MKKLSLSVFFLILLIVGCAEKPKNIGDSLLDQSDIFNIEDIVVYSSSDTSYRIAYAAGFSSTLLAGKLSNNDESITLINFLPDESIDSLKDAVIDTVELSLFIEYRLQPASPMIELDIKKIETSWSQSTFTYDSLPLLQISADSILGTFKDSMNYNATIIAQINKDYIRRWADSYIDTGNHSKFYGFALQARTIPTGLIGFTSFNSPLEIFPRLLIKYTKNGTRDSVVLTYGEDTFVSKFATPPTLTPITVQGSFGIRSKINFNLDYLKNKPLVNRPTINKASLELTLDTTANTLSGYVPDSVVAFLAMDSSIVSDRSDSTIFVFGYRKEVVPNSSPIYSFNVANNVQRWINGLKPNYGLTLRWAAEFSSADKVVFFSSTAADSTKRPKIKITYSTK
ncbi:MAG: hypothetical protein Q8L88_13670 [Bacteroidota bacterium]|nr:hypothetical protein [Bacteroidota bacterium]